MNITFKGTEKEAIDIVSTQVLSIMAQQDRSEDYVFHVGIDGNYQLIW